MRLRLLFIVAVMLLSFWPTSVVHAEVKWSDNVSEDVRWTTEKDPYIVTKSFKIEKGSTLRIDPGVTVRLRPNVKIEVFGTLEATGREGRPITFAWENDGQRWDSITVRGGKAVLNQVIISNAKVGLMIQGWGSGTGVFSSIFRDNGIAMHNNMRGGDGDKSFSLEVLHTVVTRNTTGILFTEGTTRLFRNNISENIEQGIGAFTEGIIEQNTIFANGTDGIESVSRGGNPDLVIHNNSINYNGFGGLSLKPGEYTITHNNIFGNARFDLRWLDTAPLDASRNYWGTPYRAELASRIVNANYGSALAQVSTEPMHHAVVADAPAPLPAPSAIAAAPVAAPAPAPAPAPAAPAPAPVAPRVPSVTDPVPAKAGARYFGETGHNVEGVFLTHFESRGGIGRFGFPRTEATVENGLRVQWFERGRMEHHPQHAGTPYEVQLTLLGDTLTTALRPFPTAPVPCGTTPNCRYFPETQHIVHGAFLEYFENNGGLEAFGYPISELFRDFNDDGSGRAYTMQWFQRARMELHPEVGPRVILLGLLGLEELDNRGLIR